MGIHVERLRAFVENVGRREALKRLGLTGKPRTLESWLKHGHPARGRVADDVGEILRRHERTRKGNDTKRKKKTWLEIELQHPPPETHGALENRQGHIAPEEKLPQTPPALDPRVKRRQAKREGRDGWEVQEIYQEVDGPGRSRVDGAAVHIGEVIYLDGEMKRFDPTGTHPDPFDFEGAKQVCESLARRKMAQRPELGIIQVLIYAWWQVPFNKAYERVASLAKWIPLQGELIPYPIPVSTGVVALPKSVPAMMEGALHAIKRGRVSLTEWATKRAVYIEGLQVRVFRRGADEDLERFEAEKQTKERQRRRQGRKRR